MNSSLMRGLLTVIQTFWGVTALWGGGAFVRAPDGHLLQMKVDMLRTTPFQNFLVPGLLLFCLGVASLITALLVWQGRRVRDHQDRRAETLAAVVAAGQLVWILVEMLLLGGYVGGFDAKTASMFQISWVLWGGSAAVNLFLALALFKTKARLNH